MAKRSITIAGHRTSISIEPQFWEALSEIAAAEGASVPALVTAIDGRRQPGISLSAAIRLHVLDWYRKPAGRG